MDRTKLSLKWLEVFQSVAREGAVQKTAASLGLSNSTVSHHLAQLETTVGTELFDHKRRPLTLTTAGQILLARVEESMNALRMGLTEIISEDISALLRLLRISLIEDLDAKVTPQLARHLLQDLPSCNLSFRSAASHDVLGQLQSDETDIGVAAIDDASTEGLNQRPLLRDPFVIVVPASATCTATQCLAGETGLPFLRYSRKQIIGRRVDAQLRRLRHDIPRRIELESTAAALALVAKGQAWTITTALNCAAVDHVLSDLQVLPMPDGAFSRHLSLIAREDLPDRLFSLVESHMRTLILTSMITPMVTLEPRLQDEFRLTS